MGYLFQARLDSYGAINASLPLMLLPDLPAVKQGLLIVFRRADQRDADSVPPSRREHGPMQAVLRVRSRSGDVGRSLVFALDGSLSESGVDRGRSRLESYVVSR